jgi:hypothetical protein
MKLHTHLVSLSLAGVFLGTPTTGIANDDIPDRSAVEERMADFPRNEAAQRENRAEPFELAEVDYCYRGSGVDPATGEIFDLYALCSEDVIADNLDLA